MGCGNPSLTLMLWRLKTLWRLSGGVCRELAGDWYSMGLVSVGELAHRPSGTCGRAGGSGQQGDAGTNKATGLSADRRSGQGRGEQLLHQEQLLPSCPSVQQERDLPPCSALPRPERGLETSHAAAWTPVQPQKSIQNSCS